MQSIAMDILQRSRLLILDDNTSNVRILERMLQMSGYQNIKGIYDSREVLAVCEEYKPDLLLLDLRMPYYDGFQVMEQLRERFQGAAAFPVLIITAQNERESRLRALELGARDFIGKPFDQSEMLMRVRNLLEMRLLQNQLRAANHELETKVAQRTEQLKEMQLELVERLGQAVEFRDQETGFHITRISYYSELLGRKAGLPDEAVELLLHSSTLHDIGKIAIPDGILLKPGKLTSEEYEQMKAHTVIGANMLRGSSSKLLQMAHDIALTHHERWDGTGYPHGLKGESIPAIGRIVAICDVFDALTSKRPYKEAWNEEEAARYIVQASGTHFDPYFVKVFEKAFPDILEIKQKYGEDQAQDEG